MFGGGSLKSMQIEIFDKLLKNKIIIIKRYTEKKNI